MHAGDWARLLDGGELVEEELDVREPSGEIRHVRAEFVASADPVCTRCGQRCRDCASALPAGWAVIQRDDEYHTPQVLAGLALAQLEAKPRRAFPSEVPDQIRRRYNSRRGYGGGRS